MKNVKEEKVVMEYAIIQANTVADLVRDVQKAIKDGEWEPNGGMSVETVYSYPAIYYQSMIRISVKK